MLNSDTKVAIIGAKGMLGQELLSAFSDCMTLPFDLPSFDITKPDEISSTLHSVRPDYIINTAAMTNVDDCENREKEADAINGYGAGKLAEIANSLGIPIVQFSTDYVFDGTKKDGYIESDFPNPQNMYGRSKLLGERLVREKSTQYYIIRTSYLFGVHGKNIIETFLTLLATKPSLTILSDQFVTLTSAKELARETRRMLDTQLEYGIYHQTNKGSLNWIECIAFLQSQLGTKVPVVPVTMSEYIRPAKRPQFSSLISTKLPPLSQWQDAVRDYVREKPSNITSLV